jgi:hypothetical protein
MCSLVSSMHTAGVMQSSGAREVWWHISTDHRWIVETDSNGMVIAAAGPFPRDDWHRLLRRRVLLNQHSADYVREHRRDFVRLTAEIVVGLHYENASPLGR